MLGNLDIPQWNRTVSFSGVGYIRRDLAENFKKYRRIRDCLSGEDAVKHAKELYLPRPSDDSSRRRVGDGFERPVPRRGHYTSRYDAYIGRANFLPVTGRTMAGLVGTVFFRAPVVSLPTGLKALEDDASGDGQSLEQVARVAVSYALGYGRLGLFVDYPDTGGEATTVADRDAGRVRPTVKTFEPWAVINWRVIQRGAEEILTLVVIAELNEVEDDGFEKKTQQQYRVLQLVSGVYTQSIWTKDSTSTQWTVTARFIPTDSSGRPFDRIPFKFVGSENNSAGIDHAPMDAIASVNLAHYRNSADYEESIFLVGQPTLALSGLSQNWVDEIYGDAPIMLGSREAILLPEKGSASLLQADPNTLAKEAMDTKERQMVALGARLVQQQEVQRTAKEASMEDATENSVLSSVAKNVGAAMLWALEIAGQFTGDTGIEYAMSSEYDLSTLTPEQVQSVVKSWQGGAITFSEMRAILRKGGVATLDDDKAKTELEAEQATQLAATVQYTETVAKAAAGTGTPPSSGSKPPPAKTKPPGKGALNNP